MLGQVCRREREGGKGCLITAFDVVNCNEQRTGLGAGAQASSERTLQFGSLRRVQVRRNGVRRQQRQGVGFVGIARSDSFEAAGQGGENTIGPVRRISPVCSYRGHSGELGFQDAMVEHARATDAGGSYDRDNAGLPLAQP